MRGSDMGVRRAKGRFIVAEWGNGGGEARRSWLTETEGRGAMVDGRAGQGWTNRRG